MERTIPSLIKELNENEGFLSNCDAGPDCEAEKFEVTGFKGCGKSALFGRVMIARASKQS
jgi:hypothetical protein